MWFEIRLLNLNPTVAIYIQKSGMKILRLDWNCYRYMVLNLRVLWNYFQSREFLRVKIQIVMSHELFCFSLYYECVFVWALYMSHHITQYFSWIKWVFFSMFCVPFFFISQQTHNIRRYFSQGFLLLINFISLLSFFYVRKILLCNEKNEFLIRDNPISSRIIVFGCRRNYFFLSSFSFLS